MLKYTVVLVVLAIAVTGSYTYYQRSKIVTGQTSAQVEEQPEQQELRRDWIRWREERRKEMQTNLKETNRQKQEKANHNKERKRQQEKWRDQQRKVNQQERSRGMENRLESETKKSEKWQKESKEDGNKTNLKSGKGFQQNQRITNRGRQDRDYLMREWVTTRRDSNEQLRNDGNLLKSSADDSAKKQERTIRPNYEYSYGVSHPETGDHKDQWEKRVGDHVEGIYSLDQPDGKKRVVYYEGDAKKGIETNVYEIDKTNNLRYQKHAVAHSYNVQTRFD